MIIRNFGNQKDTIDDIKNIEQARRFILIFRYNGPHTTLNCVYNTIDDNYDVYLINCSVVKGNNFLVPLGITLYCKNQYRGNCQHALNFDGKVNYDAMVSFYESSFGNRVHRSDKDFWCLSSYDCVDNTGVESEFLQTMKSELIQPYPMYYNIEDQAQMELLNPKGKYGDFIYDMTGCPMYRLGDLIDSRTKIAIVDMPYKVQMVKPAALLYRDASNCYPTDDIYPTDEDSMNPNIKFDNGIVADLGEFQFDISSAFMLITEYILNSVFSSLDVIIDTESGMFNVPMNTLKVRFDNLSKDFILKDYINLTNKIGDAVDRYFGEIDIPNAAYRSNAYPTRLYMHFSESGCKIRASNYQMKLKATDNISSSDSDEYVQLSKDYSVWGSYISGD